MEIHRHPNQKSSPFTIPEIAQILCSFVDQKDMLNVALSCRVFYYAMIGRLWHTIQPQSYMMLRKIKNALDGKGRHWKTQLDPQYHYLVKEFKCQLKDDFTSINRSYLSSPSSSSSTTATIERPFFDSFLFPKLNKFIFSYAAAQDNSIAPILRASHHLRYIDLSHCYCLSTEAIQPLLDLPTSRLETVILYGCGKIESSALITLIEQHHQTLTCLKLTDITDGVLNAIQKCHQLRDFGLEHCSDDSLTYSAITKFTNSLISSTTTSISSLPSSSYSSALSTTNSYLSSSSSLISSSLAYTSSSSSLALTKTKNTALTLSSSLSTINNNNNNKNNKIQFNKLRLRDIPNLKSEHLIAIAISSHTSLIHLEMSECSKITSEGLIELARHCPNLETVCLAYQPGMTNTVLQSFAQHCQRLKQLDITGNYSLTDACFLYKPMHLISLNISGLETQFSHNLIYQLLLQLPHLHELCLGVAFDLNEAFSILDQVNHHFQGNNNNHDHGHAENIIYDLNVEKYHTICRK
ncbi:hypothetical protein BJ944DRAFT_99912 [Cunninghamella echinulata]|nr:hypothetical protein BJ944DRAFT_99912 [Cunninghamella echinulata]